ncbi:MAG: hypothetical protein RJB26_1772 [Pseudomonadota bacterium]
MQGIDRRCWPAMALLGVLWSALASAAAPVPDCPLAKAPYSSRSPLLDLLLDPAAKAVIAKQTPGVLKPPFGGDEWPTNTPSFAAILTPSLLLALGPEGAESAVELDAALAEIPITDTAMQNRCARYDHVPPNLPEALPRNALLVFGKWNGFRDSPSVEAAETSLRSLAQAQDWALVFTDNAAVFNRAQLARFSAVIWNNVSGDALTLSQRQAFREWIEAGGGFVGIHGSGGDPAYFWDWYADVLVGARFIGHPMNPQFQQARLVVEPGAPEMTHDLPPNWMLEEEWYSFDRSPRSAGAEVLVRLDESSYSPEGMGRNLRMGDHPVVWRQCIGHGRSFYTALGHRPEIYRDPGAAALLARGIAWAAGWTDAYGAKGESPRIIGCRLPGAAHGFQPN